MEERVLGEFLVFTSPPNVEGEGKAEFVANWTSNQTKVLLDVYKKYRPKVGSFEIKNLKKLWEVIATKINEILKTNFNSSHVENRWRVIERSYKKFIDNQTKTGRGRKYFEYQEEMDDIFKGKKNVKPDCLLSTDTVEHLVEEIEPEVMTSTSLATAAVQTPEKSCTVKRRNPIATRNLTIEQIRRDRKEYNKERIEVEQEKLEVQKKKIILIKERNELLRERNELLKNRTCSTCSRDLI